MGSGDKNHHHVGRRRGSGSGRGSRKRELKDIPKGYLAVMVGQGEEQQKFIIPVTNINHPLFMQLLKEAEEEYGFDHKGPINIPCHVEEFRHIQDIIDKEKSQFRHHNYHLAWCFKA